MRLILNLSQTMVCINRKSFSQHVANNIFRYHTIHLFLDADSSVKWIDEEDIIPEDLKEKTDDWSHYINLENGSMLY